MELNLDSLSTQDRLALISQIWESLDKDRLPLSAAQQEELDRRLETLEEDRKDAVSWETLKAEMERRCP